MVSICTTLLTGAALVSERWPVMFFLALFALVKACGGVIRWRNVFFLVVWWFWGESILLFEGFGPGGLSIIVASVRESFAMTSFLQNQPALRSKDCGIFTPSPVGFLYRKCLKHSLKFKCSHFPKPLEHPRDLYFFSWSSLNWHSSGCFRGVTAKSTWKHLEAKSMFFVHLT